MTSSAHKRSSSLWVSVVEDDEAIRTSLTDLINDTDGMSVVGAYSSCESALEDLPRHPPDVLLMDIGLPGMSGIEGVRMIKPLHPSIDILMMTVYDDQERIFDSICAGASGYLLKNTPSSELIRGIREIKTGAPMSPSIARLVLAALRQQPSAAKAEYDLTPREIEILQSLVDGLSYKMIADKLFLSPFTVHSHIKHIYEKLHVHSKSEAVSKALRGKIL